MKRSATRRCYRNPPIEEALVEFRMAPGPDWDMTIPGRLHERIKDAYGGKPRQQRILQTAFQAVPGGPPGVAVQEELGRVQLVDENGRRLISLGPGVFSVNVLRPYEGWEAFRPRIERALHAYAEVSGADRVSRIGVRYVNKILVPSREIDLEHYFLQGPRTPPDVPVTITSFLNRVEHVYKDGAKLLVTFASLPTETSGQSAFLLDLDVSLHAQEPLDPSSALAKIDDLHDREGTAFEAFITDQTRELFDAA